MQKRKLFIVNLIAAGISLVGCGEKCNTESAQTDFSVMAQAADSLIDIAPDSSLIICHRFFTEYTESDSLFAQVKLIEGNAYFSLGDLDEAKKSMAEAKTLAATVGDEYTLINATSDLGVAMRVSQQPDSALSLYNEALSLIGEKVYKDEKAHLLTSIAILYANTGHLDEARDYADKAVVAAKECTDPDMIMYANSQAGAIYNLLGDKEKAFKLTREAIADARRHNLPRYELKALGHMIDLQLRTGNLDSVNFYLKHGEVLAGKFPETSVEGLGFLEEKYIALAAMNRYRESLNVQKRLQHLQSVAPTFMPPEKLWLRMARNYRDMHLTDSAAFCYERAFAVADSLRGEDTDRQLNEFYARYKTSEKELALANMERKKAQSDLWLAIMISITTILVLLFIAGIMYFRMRRKKEEMRLMQSYFNGIEQERGRLAKDLHDGICNDLYGIEMLLQTNTDRNEILADVEKIRSDVRHISHQMMPPALQEVGLAEALVGMVTKLRQMYPNTAIDSFSEPETGWDCVPINTAYGLYRIAQELTGNILRHSNPTQINISLLHKEDSISLSIKHNAPIVGIEKKGNGIGIESVKERIAAIGAKATGLPFSANITIECPVRHGKP